MRPFAGSFTLAFPEADPHNARIDARCPMKGFRFAALVSLLLAAASTRAAEGTGSTSTNAVATPVPSTHVHQLFRATTNVFSGNSPESDAAFAEIARLGVKTIISVDGGRPDVELARKHGLRYIHLPIGYDGVPARRVAELVKAAQSSPGPLYIHCHHGKHRGPAAVAVICEATAGWTTNQAVTWLKEAGTAADYPGLYRSAVEFRLPEAAALARIIELPEIARTSSLVEAMVGIDEEFDRLKAAQKTGWKNVPNQPDLTPAHTATILWEHFRELARIDDTTRRPEEYRAKLAASEKAADAFRGLLRDARADSAARDAAFQSLGQSCGACHKQYRN
jgi:protein tyrosine phosphatase (PTP) superfamily phosphohydrolase (DUF442 family)